MEETQDEKIRNKYDVYNVEFHLNQYFSQFMETNLKAVKSETKEYYKLALGFLLSVFILLSYFHKLPFPLDKPLIFICTLIYYIFAGILELYKKYYVKNIFAEFYVSKASLPKNLTKISKFFVKDLGLFLLSSQNEPFTNNYTLKIEINGHSNEETLEYNNFIYDDGFLAKEKLQKFIENLMIKMK